MPVSKIYYGFCYFGGAICFLFIEERYGDKSDYRKKKSYFLVKHALVQYKKITFAAEKLIKLAI